MKNNHPAIALEISRMQWMDVELVMSQLRCCVHDAHNSLIQYNWDIVSAIAGEMVGPIGEVIYGE